MAAIQTGLESWIFVSSKEIRWREISDKGGLFKGRTKCVQHQEAVVFNPVTGYVVEL
jgi:hypothetical protein